jgi:putative nucleotidyltransferase with HDIG domain
MAKHITLDQLLSGVEELPSHRAIAVRVVMETNRENSSALSIARLVEMDPALSALVLRLANSAVYGLRHQVSSAQRAISVVGLENVRTFAAARAAGGVGDDADDLPAGMWDHAMLTAAASAEAAKMVGANKEDAFTLGLLHDIGQMVLFRMHPDEYLDVISRAIARETTLMGAEIAAFGHAHDDVGAAVLHQWGFPRLITQAIQSHHRKAPSDAPLVRALAAGQDLALRLPDAPAEEVLAPAPYRNGLESAGISEIFAAELTERAEASARSMQKVLHEVTASVADYDAEADESTN